MVCGMPKIGGSEYEVGYRKPPRQSRWAKGTSGNYAGRPRKKKSPIGPSYSFDPFLENFLNEMWRPVALQEGEQSIELPAFTALIRAMLTRALNGDQRTAKFLFQRMEAAVDR